jgi:hypothetical protein
MQFIQWAHMPPHRKASYYNPQIKVKIKNGALDRRVRGTYGGNISDFTGQRSSQTADIETVKLLLNAGVSENATFAIFDIHDFYLGTKLDQPEFMFLTRKQLPQDIIDEFTGTIDWKNDRALVQINHSLYGLPYAGRVSAIKVTKLLNTHGYHECPSTPCLYKHATNGVYFTLVVDDYLIKFHNKSDAEHLLRALETEYEVSVDWEAKRYLGMQLDYNTNEHWLALSMPGYVQAALKTFNIDSPPHKPTISPAIYQPPRFDQPDHEMANDDSPPVNEVQIKFIERVIGKFLFYARMVDPTMLTQLNKMASRQSNPTEQLYSDVLYFLQYVATFPDSKSIITKSDMRLIVQSDGSYLSEFKSRSRAAGIHYLSSNGDCTTAKINSPITVLSSIIPAVVSSAMEAEYATMFINAKTASALRNTLYDLGYPQAPTPIITDNTAAAGVATRKAKQRKSRSIAMRYHWLRDRVDQGEFNIVWSPGSTNAADFFSKTLPAKEFLRKRDVYVQTPPSQWTQLLSMKKAQQHNHAHR